MPALIIDASVVMRWALPEPGREPALALLSLYEANRLDLAAPQLLRAEVASALVKRYRRHSLTLAQATEAFELICMRSPELAEPDVETAFRLALEGQISLWDAIYVALALARRCDLITADRRLYRSLAPHYPFVKMLGAGL